MHPYFYSCPLSYLEMVPIEHFGGNEEWRVGVRSYHQRSKEKRAAKNAQRDYNFRVVLPVGTDTTDNS